jgi:hypothetical protein
MMSTNPVRVLLRENAETHYFGNAVPRTEIVPNGDKHEVWHDGKLHSTHDNPESALRQKRMLKMKGVFGSKHPTNEAVLKRVDDARKDAEKECDDAREERLLEDIERDGKLSAREGEGKDANPYKEAKEKKAWDKGFKNKGKPDPEAARMKRETAKTHDDRDLLLLSKGNVAYRMADLLKRQKEAALTGKHRDFQRLDKEIMLLRAALGMDPMPPREVVRTHTTGKDPTSRENLVVASTERDSDWARRVTVAGFAALDKNLRNRGYEYTQVAKGSTIMHTWAGFRGAQPDTVVLFTVGRDWACAASRTGKRLDLFEFAQAADPVERGIPIQMTAATWDGRITAEVRQQYARSWALLNAEA